MEEITKSFLIELARKEKAHRSFYSYCQIMHPNFYKDDRCFLKDMCDKMQEFYYNDKEFMLINLPP